MTFCYSNPLYKQIRIPLDMNKGVPVTIDNIDFYIDGFEIDEEGNFYFLDGEPATLVCFSETTQIYRKEYKEFKSSTIYILHNKLYIFDYKYEKNNLFVLNKTDGAVESSYNKIIKNRVNSFLFRDTCLVMEVFDNKKNIDMTTKMGFVIFDLKGKYIKQANNRYNIPNALYPQEFENNTTEFMGLWGSSFLYWDYNVDTRQYIFTVRDKAGKILSSKNIDEKVFGESFYGNPSEHRRLRNGNVYVLGHDNRNAIITILSLTDLFK